MITINNHKVNPAGYTRRGVEYFPDNMLPGEKIPLIIFLHGRDEAGLNDGKGNGAPGTESGLYLNGSPLQMVKDGTLGRFAVLALQGIRYTNADISTGWAVFPDEVAYAATLFLAAHPEISGIGLTGLSAGGRTVLDAINLYPSLFIFGFSLSPAAIDINSITTWTGKGLLIASHGKDDTVTNAGTTATYVDKINALSPGSAVMQYTSGGHWPSVWVSMYNTTVVSAAGKIYKWQDLLSAKILNKGLLLTAATTGGTTNKSMIAVAKITIVAGVGTYDASASTGGESVRFDSNGGIKFQQGPVGTAFTGITGFLPNTSYSILQTVWDVNAINKVTANYVITTDAKGNSPAIAVPPPVVIPPIIIPPVVTPAKKLLISFTIPAKTVNIYMLADGTISNEVL